MLYMFVYKYLTFSTKYCILPQSAKGVLYFDIEYLWEIITVTIYN